MSDSRTISYKLYHELQQENERLAQENNCLRRCNEAYLNPPLVIPAEGHPYLYGRGPLADVQVHINEDGEHILDQFDWEEVLKGCFQTCQPEAPRTNVFLDGLTSEERKEYPICEGLLDYFPNACAYVAHVSYVANEQHNPGEEMHWAFNKSVGNGNEILRHLVERGKIDTDKLRHSGKLAWRAFELLEREILAEKGIEADVEE